MTKYDQRSFQLFAKYEQAIGISTCLLEVCNTLDYKTLNGIKLILEVTLKELCKCSVIMNDLGQEKCDISHIELFKAYKVFIKAHSQLWERLEAINPVEYRDASLLEHITNSAFALFDLINDLTEITNDLLENPPSQKAA